MTNSMRIAQAHAVHIFLIVYVCHLSHADLYFWRDRAALCPHCTVPISRLSRLASGLGTIAHVLEFAGRPRNGNGRLQTCGDLPVSTLMLLFSIDIVLVRTAPCAFRCHYVSTSEIVDLRPFDAVLQRAAEGRPETIVIGLWTANPTRAAESLTISNHNSLNSPNATMTEDTNDISVLVREFWTLMGSNDFASV